MPPLHFNTDGTELSTEARRRRSGLAVDWAAARRVEDPSVRYPEANGRFSAISIVLGDFRV